MGERDWMVDANCATTDPDLFTPAKGQPTLPAKRICAECTVRQQCLQYALSRETVGIWAGLSGSELRRLRMKADAA